MTTIRVWAPQAQRVALDLDDASLELTPDDRGWWSAGVPAAPPDFDYAIRLNRGDPLPDPRSLSQPQGVLGRSRHVDHDQFPWTDQHWQSPPLVTAIIYELHIGTFTPQGTFAAAAEKLDYLRDLGVTHIELMPVNEFSGQRGWGYDGVDIYAPHHAYGGPTGLKRLVDAAHARGLGVILDVVYNHFGPEGCFIGQFGPYFTGRYHTPWGLAVNFDDAGSDEVRRFVIDNALMWLRDYHIDGLRLDGVHAIFDQSAAHILEELAGEVRPLAAELGRHLLLIAESDLNDPRLVRPPAAGGYGLDAQWSDDFHHALHTVLTGERDGYYQDFGRLADLAKALRQGFVYDGQYSPHRRRRHGRPPTHLFGWNLVVFLQNHDQVGNRARGERIGHLVNFRRVQIGAALLLTSPFIPLLFQGEEWGATTPFHFFTDFRGPDLARAVREGRRREFTAFGCDPASIPDPQARETFARSKLNWDEPQHPPHAGLRDWYRRLIALRRARPALCDGRLDLVRTQCDESASWLTLTRGSGHSRVTVVCNLSRQRRDIPLDCPLASPVLATSDPNCQLHATFVELAPESVLIAETRI